MPSFLSTGSIIRSADTGNYVFLIETEDILTASKKGSFLRFGTIGGKLQFNESPLEAFKRELKEEIKFKDFELNLSSVIPRYFVINQEGIKEKKKYKEKYSTEPGLKAVFKKEGDLFTPKACQPSLVFVFSGLVDSPFPKGETGVVLELTKDLLVATLNQNLTIGDLLSKNAPIYQNPGLDLGGKDLFLKPVGTAELLAYLFNMGLLF